MTIVAVALAAFIGCLIVTPQLTSAKRGSLPYELEAMHLNPNTVTVSGISAGAAFAVQYEIAFSSQIRGAGIIAGIPYYCAQGMIADALMCMSSPETISLSTILTDAAINAALGKIDPLVNMKNHTVRLWSGTQDTVVVQGTMFLVAEMYEQLSVTNLQGFFNYSSEHAWITDFWGNSCSTLGQPYVNNCLFDFAGNFLHASYSGMGLKWNPNRGTYNDSNMIDFDMTPFGASPLTNSLDTTAYLYIPQRCKSGTKACGLHINFHGCTQYRTEYIDHREYVSHTGLNEWAEANDIVVFYPQTVANSLVGNPDGCFDWWGYAGSNYAHKNGVQMQVVYDAMSSLIGN